MQILNQEKVSCDASLRSCRRLSDYYASQLPENCLTEEEKKESLDRISGSLDRCNIHIYSLYARGYSLGKNLSGRIEIYYTDRTYLFYLKCLASHLAELPLEIEHANELADIENPERRLENRKEFIDYLPLARLEYGKDYNQNH